MIRIGIVGAENSHTVAIAKTLNIDKKVPGCRIVSVWGESGKYAKDAAARGEIPQIVKNPEDMIGQVDAACVDHRHAKFHLPAVLPLLEAKIPLFVDNPYLTGTKTFCKMFKTGKTDETAQTMLTPVAVLEALEKSIKQRKRIKVPSIA